jgi:hypothetical protein
MNRPNSPFYAIGVDKNTGRPRVELIYAPNAEDAKSLMADYEPDWIIVRVYEAGRKDFLIFSPEEEVV